MKEVELGLAGKLTKAFITSPLSIMLFFVMFAIGIFGLIFTPRQEDPQISVPVIDLFVNYPGASSNEVSSIIIKPLERLMSQILGVKHVYSVSDKGMGAITVEFDVGQNMNDSIVKVREKVMANLEVMPPGASVPLIKSKEIDDVPIINLTLWSKTLDDSQLRSLAMEVLQQLAQVEDTNNGFIVGGRKQIFKVDIYPSRLANYKISLQQITQIIRNINVRKKVGNIELNNLSLDVHAGAFLQNASDIENLVISTFNSKPVYVRDVADVALKAEETKQIVNHYSGAAADDTAIANGEQAVTIAIAKKFGTNGIKVADDILKKLATLKGRIIPNDVNISVSRNYGKSAQNKVNALIKKLFIATGVVTILVFFALGWRPALVVTMVIPLVLLMTIFATWVFGMTIDRVSLFALIFSIGILVDDAIVVVENVYRRWLIDNKITIKTAIDAVREVGNPTILATFTVVAALVPMAAVRGMMGPYMMPIPILGSVAMLISLFAAFVFAPYFIMKFVPPIKVLHKMHKKEERENKFLCRFFSNIINKLMINKVLGFGFLIGIIATFFLVISMFWTTAVVVKMLPLDNKSEFSIVLDMPDGTALTQTQSTLHKMTEVIRKIDEVVAVQTYAGLAKPFDFNGLVRHYYLRNLSNQGEIQITLVDKNKRKRSSHEIAVQVRLLLKPIAKDVFAEYAVVEMPPGPPVLRSVVAEIYGPDRNTRHKLANDITDIFKKTKTMSDIDNLMRDEYPVINFKVNRTKASSLGIDSATIQQTLLIAMSDYIVGTIRLSNALEPSNIVISIPLATRSELSNLLELPIPTKNGKMIPLSELGIFSYSRQDDLIYYKDLLAVEYVLGEPIGDLSSPIYAMFAVDDALLDYKTAAGDVIQGNYLGPPDNDNKPSFTWAGEWTVTFETFRDMGIAFMVALVFIYMLVVWQFGNFIIPAIIMAPIPLTLLGIIPGHYLLGAEFTATSMIGWIALAGIIVRNSILLIDFTVQEYARGTKFFDAVINSCSSRTRPILITAFALVGGSSVILSDPIFQGMAISLLFGVLISTVLTLLVIPLGTISVGEKVCKDIAINMGLIEDDIDSDAKYNQEDASTVTKTTEADNAKKWLKSLLKDKYKVNKIDTSIFLKKEDNS